MKEAICASLVLGGMLSLAEAGPRAGACVRSDRAWCPPVKAICPPTPRCPPVICRTWPVYYFPAYGGWAPSPIVSSTSFSNVSYGFDYGESGIYRVPAPVIAAPPLTNSPGVTFSWRH
ncbi:MAG TPA: hypothetical protein VIS96_10430 [Terrimicrobiaceae bacterium]